MGGKNKAGFRRLRFPGSAGLLVVTLVLLCFNFWYFRFVRPTPPQLIWQRIVHGPSDRILDDPLWRSTAEEYERLNRDLGERPCVVFAGDSITRRLPVEELRPAAAEDSVRYVNRGIHGDTALGLARRFGRNVGNLEVRRLFVLIGANDLSVRSPRESVRLLEEALAPMAPERVVVQSLLPAARGNARARRAILEYNQLLQDLCRRRDYAWLDLYSSFVDEDGWMRPALSEDGRHPNAEGNELWWSLLRPWRVL